MHQVGELTLEDMEELRQRGVCLMANFKTALVYLVQPISTSLGTVE
jgi:hypothetical protein